MCQPPPEPPRCTAAAATARPLAPEMRSTLPCRDGSALAADGSDLRDLRASGDTGIGAPVRHQDHARLHQFQAAEVAGELLQAAGPVGDGAGCLVNPQGLLERLARVDAVVDG